MLVNLKVANHRRILSKHVRWLTTRSLLTAPTHGEGPRAAAVADTSSDDVAGPQAPGAPTSVATTTLAGLLFVQMFASASLC